MYPRLSIEVMETIDLPKADKEKIQYKNAQKMFGLK